MFSKEYIVLWLVLVSFTPVLSQTNGVRQNLMPCYNSSALINAQRAIDRPPASVNILIEFVRRLEESNPTMNSRVLSAVILQRLRQDGIMGTGRVTDTRFGIPYSPKRLEAYKSTLILQAFLTNSSLDLNTGDLDPTEVCSLHYMISSTIDNRVRNDEATTCSRSSRYTSRILRRRRRGDEAVTEASPEVPEVPSNTEDGNFEVVEGVEGFGVRSILGSTNDISQCPIELGVVYTNYGTIKAGQVLVGIATGMNAETVSGADNRYASTVAGEIAEAALTQATQNIVIGASGGWNSTINPKYYFLQRNTQLQTTDAEIRGSLDGLYLALRMDAIRSTFADVRVSQLLDLYYSPYQRGVFDESFRACNRNLLYTELVPAEALRTQVAAIMGPLDNASQYGQTVSSTAYEALTTAAIDSFNSYLAQLASRDLACQPTDSAIERVATDLWIFIDASWNYFTVQSVLSYVLDNIDVSRFGSRYTIFSGQDLTNVTSNSTNNLLDFYKQYNETVHRRLSNGFAYTRIFELIESLGRAKLDNNTYTSGESTVVLLIPRTIPSDSDNVFLNQRREIFRQFIPDISFLVLGTGSQNSYSSIVDNTSRDVITLTETTNEDALKQTAQNVIGRIKNVPRAIINPNCGSSFSGSSSSFSVTDYVEPKGVNYYRIAPNYIFRGGNLRITENSYGSIDVCISRDQSRPNNQTAECRTLRSEIHTVDMSGYCGDSVSGCSPVYISITGNATQIRCTDYLCRYPDNIKYTISMENVGCASCAIRIISNIFILVAFVAFLRF